MHTKILVWRPREERLQRSLGVIHEYGLDRVGFESRWG